MRSEGRRLRVAFSWFLLLARQKKELARRGETRPDSTTRSAAIRQPAYRAALRQARRERFECSAHRPRRPPSKNPTRLSMLRLELIALSKQYPAVKANDRVDLRVKPGEIHAVLGENGAGKSTLMKMIYGAVRPDEGEIRWNGQPVVIRNPHEARQLGISMVYQHFSLFDTLTVAENVWLGLDRSFTLAKVRERITQVAHSYG